MSPTPTERALRDALHAAAPTDTHVEAGLAELHARVDGMGAPPVGLAGRSTASRRRILAAAAAVVVVAATAAAVLVARHDRDRTDVVTTPEGAATGWYVPEGLDPDWQLESVSADFQDVNPDEPCPCRTWLWVDADAQRTLLVVRSTGTFDVEGAISGGIDGTPVTPVDLGDGITGVRAATGIGAAVRWGRDGHRWSVVGLDVAQGDLEAAARRIASQPSDPRPADGSFELIDEARAAGGIDAYRDVHVILRHRVTKARVAYTLSPEGRGDTLGLLGPVPSRIELAPGLPDGLVKGQARNRFYWAHWPGADVVSNSESAFGADPGPATPADSLAMLRSLRPATAAGWAAFTRTATGDVDDSLRVARLWDLTEPSERSTTTTTGDGGEVANPADGLTLAPVLATAADCSAFATSRPSADGSACFELGPTVATGADLRSAQVVEMGDGAWAVSVRVREGSKADLGAALDACFDGDPTCPPPEGQDRGAIAIVWRGNVISAPAVNGTGLVEDALMISTIGGKAVAEQVAEAINGG